MADLDWRVWLYNRLIGANDLLALLPASSIYGAGSITGIPDDKPFIQIKLGAEVVGSANAGGVPGTSVTDCTVAVHDEPGSYNLINQILQVIKDTLCGPGERVGQVPDPGGIAVKWESTGADMADQGFGTLFKSSEYTLVGRNGHG